MWTKQSSDESTIGQNFNLCRLQAIWRGTSSFLTGGELHQKAKRILVQSGCTKVRQGKEDHEICTAQNRIQISQLIAPSNQGILQMQFWNRLVCPRHSNFCRMPYRLAWLPLNDSSQLVGNLAKSSSVSALSRTVSLRTACRSWIYSAAWRFMWFRSAWLIAVW